MKHSCIPLVLLSLLSVTIQRTVFAQERPNPGPAPNNVTAPPPSLAEVSPFPSNTDDRIAVIAHLYDPKRNRLIISVDSQSTLNRTKNSSFRNQKISINGRKKRRSKATKASSPSSSLSKKQQSGPSFESSNGRNHTPSNLLGQE